MNRGGEDDRGPWILHNEIRQRNGRCFFFLFARVEKGINCY